MSLLSICEIRPHLFISGYASIEEHKLRQLGITHCVDVTNLPKTLRLRDVEYLVIPADDSTLADLKKYFQTTADFVRKAKESGGKALVYCSAGISRAATLCIVSLMVNEEITLKQAFQQVLIARPIIAPNLGFWRQMIDWEAKRSGVATVTLLKGWKLPVPDVYLHRSEIIADRLPRDEVLRKATGARTTSAINGAKVGV